MLMVLRRMAATTLAFVLVGALGVTAVAAYDASSGSQAFWHTTFYWHDNA